MTTQAQRWRDADAGIERPSEGLSLLTKLALAAGVAFVGAKLLDHHKHVCDGCGYQWSHFGKLSHGDDIAHTCKRCGCIQWARPGEVPA